jgi:hypothetical protein
MILPPNSLYALYNRSAEPCRLLGISTQLHQTFFDAVATADQKQPFSALPLAEVMAPVAQICRRHSMYFAQYDVVTQLSSRQSPFIGNGSSSNEHDKRRQSASQNSQSKPVRNRGQKTWRFVLVSLPSVLLLRPERTTIPLRSGPGGNEVPLKRICFRGVLARDSSDDRAKA